MEAGALGVRRAAVDDASAIARVELASCRAAYAGLMPAAFLSALDEGAIAERWRGSLGREDARGKRTLVAEADRGIIGYATVGAGPDDAGRGMLLLMYVAPESWGRGAGRALMARARDALRVLGYSETALWVLERNERARRFYERDGWRPDDAAREDDYGGIALRAIRYVSAL